MASTCLPAVPPSPTPIKGRPPIRAPSTPPRSSHRRHLFLSHGHHRAPLPRSSTTPKMGSPRWPLTAEPLTVKSNEPQRRQGNTTTNPLPPPFESSSTRLRPHTGAAPPPATTDLSRQPHLEPCMTATISRYRYRSRERERERVDKTSPIVKKSPHERTRKRERK
jgi:hypothetical protein